MANQNLTLEWAEKYIALNWSVIPLKPKSKVSMIPWQEYQTRKAPLEEVKIWLKKWPDMNLGAVTGKISGIVVLDLDGAEGSTYGRAKGLASTCTTLTGKGKQLYYKWTKHVDNSASKIAPGVDVRGDGGYVVVPSSVHPNGKRYRWERCVPQSITTFPMDLLGVTEIVVNGSTDSGKQEGWIAEAVKGMTHGNIDDTLVSILGRMRRDGWSDRDALVVLEPLAREKGATEGHVEDKIRNIWSRYEPKAAVSQLYGGTDGLHIHSPGNDDSFDKFQLGLSQPSSESGLSTGFRTLDRYCEGGLKSERLFTVAARTGTGKTNFAIALAAQLCKQGKKVLYFSTEFRYEKIWSRFVPYCDSLSILFRDQPFYVCDSFSPNIAQVEEAIKRITPDVFIFDHINHIGEDRETLGAFMQGCNFLQRKYDCQGVMIAQLSRAADFVENGKRIEPRMSMVKGSGTIEQASSRVLLLSETRVTPEMNEIVGVLDKNDTGDKGLIQFGLKKNPYRFEEIA